MEVLQSVNVFAPATVANVASGFDVLGFALEQPGDQVEVHRKDEKRVDITSVSGEPDRLPTDPEKNTASVAAKALLESLGYPFGVDIRLRKNMPLSSGLGSSAASAVAAVYGTNILASNVFAKEELLPFTLKAEEMACGTPHADNVAPSLLGGFVLIRSYDPLDIIKLPVPDGLACAIAHPHTEVQTQDARRVLKKEIRLSDAVRQWGNLAALVAALYKGDLELLGRSLQDVVAEPIRSLLIPGFPAVKKAALDAGALGCSISGSGPSLFSLCGSLESAKAVARTMQETFMSIGLDCDLYLSRVNETGPLVLPPGFAR